MVGEKRRDGGFTFRWQPADAGGGFLLGGGVAEPDDLFAAVEAGADTFDCVNPSRVARNAAIYSPDGRFNLTRAQFRRDFNPLVLGCGCYTCTHYSRAYLHHLYKAKEMFFSTLATIHNEHFTVRLVDGIRAAIEAGRCAIVQGNVLELPFENERFDVVTAFETVYFWPEIARCFTEIHRVLKAGGVFMITNETSGKTGAHEKWQKLVDGLSVYTGEELESLLSSAGFARVEIDEDLKADRLNVRAYKAQ